MASIPDVDMTLELSNLKRQNQMAVIFEVTHFNQIKSMLRDKDASYIVVGDETPLIQ